MDQIVVTAKLKTPLIFNGYMTLDALLMAELQVGDVSHLIQQVDGLYFASAAILDNHAGKVTASFVASMRPQHTPEWLDHIKPNTKSGDVAIGDSRAREAGNVINAYDARVADAVVWYAVGDKAGVLEVVSGIGFIGKRRASGYGQVSRWSVEEGQLDGVVGYADEPLRPVPVEMWPHGGDHVVMDCAWKPPYWSIENRSKCFVPS